MNIPEKLADFYASSPMREGILCWYPFEAGKRVIDLTRGALTDLFARLGLVECQDAADYIVVLDPADFNVEALHALRARLNPHGRLLLAYENPFGLRYFSGKRSPHADKPFTSFTGADSWPSMAAVKTRLTRAGFVGQKWYYPLTDHWFATEIYSDAALPNEFLNQRFIPYVYNEGTLLFDEQPLYREVVRNGAFPFMCGAYLVEARMTAADAPCPADYIAITANREPANRFATVLSNDGMVRKTPLCPEGLPRAQQLYRNHQELAALGINVVKTQFEGDTLTMERLHHPVLCDYWAAKLADGTFDEAEMFAQFDTIRGLIYKAARNGKCYWEMVPANCFYDEANNDFIFFDQEYAWDDITPDAAVARAIGAVKYAKAVQADPRAKGWLKTLQKRYKLTSRWEEMTEYLVKTYYEVYGQDAKALYTAAKV